jgi:hypothetical protein
MPHVIAKRAIGLYKAPIANGFPSSVKDIKLVEWLCFESEEEAKEWGKENGEFECVKSDLHIGVVKNGHTQIGRNNCEVYGLIAAIKEAKNE